mmetsp:Transcript_75781/g.225927  ORF Transcript_75781/g.225927 Transcript_75781/m.225927 type:complete len:204 (-) Transcript_75781:79-690(-)
MPAPRNSLNDHTIVETRRSPPPKRRARSPKRSRSPAVRATARKSPSPCFERRRRGRQSCREEEEDDDDEEDAWNWQDNRATYGWERWDTYHYYQGGPPRGHRGGGKGRRAYQQSGGGGCEEYVPCARVYVANLPDDITEGLLMRKFRTYGDVLGLKVIPGRPGTGRCGAIIRFSAPGAAEAAISALQDKVDIRHAKPNPRWDR